MSKSKWFSLVTIIMALVIVSSLGRSAIGQDEPRPFPPHPTPDGKGIPIDLIDINPPKSEPPVEFFVSGESTRGKEFELGAIKITLPQNATLNGVAIGESCLPNMACPKTPTVSIVLDSGEKADIDQDLRIFERLSSTDADYANYRGKFDWLVEQIGRDGKQVEWVTRAQVRGEALR